MRDNVIKFYAPNLICICVDAVEDGDYIGKFWHQYGDEPGSFHNMTELLLKMEELYDEWDFPQKSTTPRSFREEQGAAGPGQNRKRQEPNPGRIENRRGAKGTFIIHVKYRQNATWQGQVLWVEENTRKYFQSVLELLKLMDSAFETGLKEGAADTATE